MIAYILKVTLCWLFFYGLYELFLKKRTFFNANRSYLLITLIIGLTLPLLEYISWKNESNIAHVIYPVLLEIDDIQAVVSAKTNDSFNWMKILLTLYVLGVILSLGKLILGVVRITSLYYNSEREKRKNYTLVKTNNTHLPFSFLNLVFVSNRINFTPEFNDVLKHELEHIKGRHSLDILFIEILKVVFWCSPMIYFYKHALKEVHEYMADHVVVKNSNKVSYKQLLLNQTNDNLQLALTHQFFNSHIKNRLKMINQKRSGRPTLVMYALGIPVLMILLAAFTYAINPSDSVTNNSSPEMTETTLMNESDTVPPVVFMHSADNKVVYKEVDQMPIFPSCKDLEGSQEEKESCSKEKMLELIYTNIRYPKEARVGGIQGTNVVTFVITKTGEVEDIRLVSNIGSGTGEESIKVVKSMSSMGEKWSPGVKDNENVNVLYTLPITFKLEGDEGGEVLEHNPLLELMVDKTYQTENMVINEDENGFKIYGDGFQLASDYSDKYPKPTVYVDDELWVYELGDIDVDKMAYMSVFNAFASNSSLPKGSPAIFKFVSEEKLESQFDFPPLGEPFKDDVVKISADKITVVGFSDDKAEKKPYIEIDGVPWDKPVGEIDSEIIGTLNIYKGNAALDKYGEKAKYNAIIISTKEGDSNIKFEKEKTEENTIASEPMTVPGKIKLTPSGKEPLFVVDGEEMIASFEKEELKPEDIKTINVLKGEKALAKYGDKGADGVIEIITKKGAKKKKKQMAFQGDQVDEMAYFPGCSDILDLDEKRKCSNLKLVSFIAENTKYPKAAKKKGVEGLVVTKFIVTKEGTIKDIGLRKGIKGLNKEAKRVVALMNEKEIIWEPALFEGNPVPMEFTLPIKFKLPEDKSAKSIQVEPKFSDCDDLTDEKAKKECNDLKKKQFRAALEALPKDDSYTLQLDEYSAFPNPSKGDINLRFKADAKPVQIYIYDNVGNLIWKKSVANFNGNFDERINLENVVDGMTFIRIVQEGQLITKKLLLEK